MKTIKNLMLLCLIIALLSACRNDPGMHGVQSDADDQQNQWQTYNNTKYHFTIQFPSGWQVMEVPTPEYPTTTEQVWFVSGDLPLPQTDARVDIALIFTSEDPSPDWEPQYFDNYKSDILWMGNIQAQRISGINKESKSPEIVVLAKIGDTYLQALSNHGEASLDYFDRVIASIQFAQIEAQTPPLQATTDTQNKDEKTIVIEGIGITFPSSLAEAAYAQKILAYVDPSGFIYNDYPAHVRIDFAGPYTARDPFARFQPGRVPWLALQNPENPEIVPQIFIFETTGANALFGERIAALKTLLDDNALSVGGELPVLPTFNSAQDFHEQVKLITFQGGHGLRFITRYSQGATPVVNPTIFYTFQGLTDDGSLYIAAFFPVYISILPDEIQIEDWDAFNQGYKEYLADLTSRMEMLESGDFEPDLELIDALISSIELPIATSLPDPSPTQSLLQTPEVENEPLVIEPDNARQVGGLARLGKGAVEGIPFYAPEGMPIFSPDGLKMAIPTSAGIYIHDAGTLEELNKIPVGTAFIAFSPDGNLLAASERGAVSLWDPATGNKVGELSGSPYIWELSFSPDGSLLAAATSENEIVVWSLAGRERLFNFPGNRLRFSPDGELAIITVYGENQVNLYETHSGTEVNKWDFRHAGFAPGGQLWLEDNETVRLVYVDRNLVTAPFNGTQPSFSADGMLMALFANRQISLYDHQKGRRIQSLEGNYVNMDGVLFSPDGQTLAGDVYTLHCPTCSEMDGLDRYLVLWRSADGSIINKIEHPSGWMGYSVDGIFLAAVQTENVQIVKTADGSIVNKIDGFTAPIAGMALSPDGKTVAAVHETSPYTLRLWDLQTRRVNRTLHSPQAPNLSTVDVAYSPDEKYLAVGGDLWELATGKRLAEIEQAIGEKTSCWSSSVAFSPEGKLATGCFEGQLDLWSIPDGALIKSIGSYKSWVNGLEFSPDGEHLAAIYSDPDSLVQVWQLPEGEAVFTLHGGHFTRVVYSADGKTLATVMANEEYDQYGWQAGFVQIWNASNGAELVQLDLNDAVSIAFSPDGHILATGSYDGTLRLWEIAGGKLLLEASGHYAPIERVIFNQDGTLLISGSLDGTISLWGIQN